MPTGETSELLANSQKGMQEGHENTMVLTNIPGQCRTLSTYLGEGTQYPALQGCYGAIVEEVLRKQINTGHDCQFSQQVTGRCLRGDDTLRN